MKVLTYAGLRQLSTADGQRHAKFALQEVASRNERMLTEVTFLR